MTSKDVNDPIVAFNPKNVKNDILMFKDEALKDFKEAQKKVNEKYQTLNFEVKEKLDAYEQRITAYESKIIQLSNLINTDKTIRDKVDNLMEFKEKTTDTMITEKIRLDNFRNDLNFNVNRIDDILKSSVIYPDIIGGISKFKTFHDFIDYVLTQCSQNVTFREKSTLDLKNYKTKLDNTISSFNSQINALLNTTSEYTKTCVKECEDRMKSIYNIYDDRLQDARIENANYAIGLEKATDVLKKELENLYVIKKELYEKVDAGILEVKHENTRVVKLFTGYKKNFNIMQHKFTQLSDFIKDIRFRINIKEDVKRREYSRMSDLINFDKKKNPGFYDGIFDNKKEFKSGLGSQLKDYIEGRITADQLFKKKSVLSKSVPMGKGNFAYKRKSTIESNFHVPELGEDAKLNFVDLIKTSLKKRLTLDQEDFNKTQNASNRDIIKEEEEDDNMSPRESILSKTVKIINVNKDYVEKDKESDKKNERRKGSLSKMGEKNKMEDKYEKVNKIKIEESKIQIVSKDKDKEKKEQEKNPEQKKEKKDRSSIKNVIKDLFSVKDIMDNIKNQNNNSPLKENKSDLSEKKKIIVENNSNSNNNNSNSNSNNNIISHNNSNNNIISHNNSNNNIISHNNSNNNINKNNNSNNNINKNNISNNNINKNNISNNNIINNNNSSSNIISNKNNNNNSNNTNAINSNNSQNKIDINKINKNNIKSAIPMNRNYNKNEEINLIRKNNTGFINNNLTFNNQKNRTISTAHENKKVGAYDPRAVNVNIYNAILNPATNCIQTIGKPSPKKKSNSSNQKNNKYALKLNTFNPGYSSGFRDYNSIKKEETRKLESMYNDLVSYLPKNDMSNEENKYYGHMKMK